MIKSPSKELTFIIYNTPNPPKYVRINKGLLKSLVIVVPLFVILSITFSFLYSAFLKNKIALIKSKEPEIINSLTIQKKTLKEKIISLERSNKELTEKLAIGAPAESSFSSLNLFTAPLGMKDLRDEELVKFENTEVTSDKSSVILKFNLANNSPSGTKLSGFISVVQYQDNLIQYYPNYELGHKNMRMEFSEGESFSFSRFRPTIVKFDKKSSASSKYKIYIFSRSGDLLVYKQIGPFNVE
jgi:hypothetical protein